MHPIMATRRLKHRYIQGLGIIIMVLALVRCVFPSIGTSRQQETAQPATTSQEENEAAAALQEKAAATQENGTTSQMNTTTSREEATATLPVFSADGSKTTSATPPREEKRASRYVAFPPLDYPKVFNDSNHVQLVAARQWGVSPVKDRSDAEQRSNELVFMGSSPYYDMAHLDSSIPYLVPHAALLLQDIGIAFTDSLLARHMPLYQMVVSSVLRSENDVARLRTKNKNATEQSCHLYATTFDINYTAFTPVGSAPPMDEAMEIKLKNVLGQVLYDMHRQGRCYVKHERLQPCFHITVR